MGGWVPHSNHVAVFIEDHLRLRWSENSVLLVVTVEAHILKQLVVESDERIVDVHRVELDRVMHDVAQLLPAVLT